MKKKRDRKSLYLFVLAGVAVAIALTLLVAPWASSSPDGLEKVAKDQGFEDRAQEPNQVSPTAGYSMPGVGSSHPALATALAGMAGTVAIFLIAWGLALVLKRKGGEEEGGTTTADDKNETHLPR